MPIVTVLMAVYNSDRYLRQAIDRILQQTFQDFEFLIINDGSTDTSGEIIPSYRDRRIRLIDNEQNLGLPRSLNRGLKLAQGDLIARQDADDISEPERLAKQVAFLSSHPDVALLGTWYRKIDGCGNFIGDRPLPCHPTDLRWSLLFYCPFVHTSVMLRKQVVEQVGFYDETITYGENYDFWGRIARQFAVANLDQFLVQYRINHSSMTATYGNVIQQDSLRITTDQISHILWCNRITVLNNPVYVKTILPLLIRAYNQVNGQDVKLAITELSQLHSAFCQYYQLNQVDRKTHWSRVSQQLSRRLVELSDRQIRSSQPTLSKVELWQLLVRAWQLHPSTLLTKLFLKSMILNLIK